MLDDARELATERWAELVDRAEIERDALRSGVDDVRMRLEAVRTRVHDARARALREGGDVDARLRVVVGATQDARRHRRVVLHAIRRDEHELEAAHDGTRERAQQVQVRATRPDEHEAAKPGFRARRGQRPAPLRPAARPRRPRVEAAVRVAHVGDARRRAARSRPSTLREPLWQYVTIG